MHEWRRAVVTFILIVDWAAPSGTISEIGRYQAVWHDVPEEKKMQRLGWVLPMMIVARKGGLIFAQGATCGGRNPRFEASGINQISMAQHMRKHWWKDINLVRQEIEHFCNANSLPSTSLPSTSQLRNCPGGNHLINAVQQHGGIVNLSMILDIPCFSSARLRASEKHTQSTTNTTLPTNSPLLARKHTSPQSQDHPAKSKSTHDSSAGVDIEHPNAAKEKTRHGYFADENRFRAELMAFGKEQASERKETEPGLVCAYVPLCVWGGDHCMVSMRGLGLWC